MKVKHLAILVALWLHSPRLQAEEAKYSAGEVQSRMNQIYYWHLAEELNISADQEKAMVKTLEESQKQRLDLLTKRDTALSTLRKATEKPSGKETGLKEALQVFEKNSENLAKVDRSEFNSLRKLFGDQTLARFLVIRDSITERLRNSLRKSPVTQSNR